MVLLAVNGGLMRGLEANGKLVNVDAKFVREATTTPEYRLYSVEDSYPGMLKVPHWPVSAASGDAVAAGTSIAVEIWDIPEVGFSTIVLQEPPGLCVGKVRLAGPDPSTSEEVLGVLAEPWVVQGTRDISEFGGWRAYVGRGAGETAEPVLAVDAEGASGGTEAPKAGPPAWLVEGLKPAEPGYVSAYPYNWPFDGNLTAKNTALIIIDMQVDFCGKGGYVDFMGYDLSLTRAPIEPIRALLEACRDAGVAVVHTREGHRPDLADLPANKLWRSERIGAGIGSKGPMGRVLVRGEVGWDIIPELKPRDGEPIIDKPGKGAFYSTDLDLVLKGLGVRNLILTGVTTDVCVHTTMRDANDRGYECLILSDCTGATDPGNHDAALKTVTMSGGIFGSVSTGDKVVQAIKQL